LIGPDQLTNTSTPSSEQGSTSPETTMRLGMKRDILLLYHGAVWSDILRLFSSKIVHMTENAGAMSPSRAWN